MDRRSATTALAATAATALAAAGSRPAAAQTAGATRPSFVETKDGASLFHVD